MTSMLVAEIKDHCAEARSFLSIGKPEAGLSILNKVIASTDDPVLQGHPLMGVVFALKAEILQCLADNKSSQVACIDHAFAVSQEHLNTDFESVAPVLLNIIRYHVKDKQQDNAKVAAGLLLLGCQQYYGNNHPRYFQLQRWIEEAGCVYAPDSAAKS